MNVGSNGYLKRAASAIVGGLCVFLISCSIQHPTHQTSVQESESILQQSIRQDQKLSAKGSRPPANLNSAMLPPLSSYVNPVKQTQARFDVSANKIPARDFFMGLVSGTDYNMIISPNISGTISLELKNVTIRQALDAVRDIYGYDYRQTSYGFEVSPPRLQARLFHINYLDVQRTGKSYTQLTTGQVSNVVGSSSVGGSSGNTSYPTGQSQPGTASPLGGLGTISSIETKSEMKFWQQIEKTITGMMGKEEGHTVTVNAQTGIISVRAFPAELNQVSRYINSLQSSLNRQVILEAKILEVQLNDEYQAGVDWSILGNPANDAVDGNGNLIDSNAGLGQDGTKGFLDTELKDFTGIFAFRVKGNFKALVQMLQSQGNVQVLSSPHISTVNNQKAVIKVGQDEFFVTGVSTSNTIIGSNTLPSQDVTLTPFFSGITLDVTPEISSDDTVVLHIHPSVSLVKEQVKEIGLGTSATGTPNNLTLPLAESTIRESDNIVRAKNGQVVVIGGLMQNNMKETLVSTPWLGKMPFIGALFRRTKQESIKSELVILLRPLVANNRNFVNKMQDSERQFKKLQRPFHEGSLPKVFGNEGECADDE